MTGSETMAEGGSDGAGRRLVGILSAIGFATLVLLGGGAAVFYARARLLDLVVAGTALLVWAVVAWRRPAWRPRSTMWPGLAAAALTFAISTVTSGNARLGVEYTTYVLILSALYTLLVALLGDRVIRPRLLLALPGICTILVIAYLTLVAIDWQRFWSVLGRLDIPPLRPNDQALAYSNPSVAMAVAILSFVCTIGIVGVDGRRRYMVGLLGIGVLAVSFLTGSRGGMFGVGTGLLGVVIAALLVQGPRLVDSVRRDRRGQIAAASVAVGVVVTAVVFWPVLQMRLLTGGADLRASFWVASARAFLAHPITGTGPGTWPVDRLQYTQPPDSDVYIPHAHNIEINAAAELGLFGLVVGALIIVLAGLLIRDGLRSPNAVRRRWGYVATFAICYLIGHQQFDVFANAPAVLAVGALPFGVLDSTFEGRLRFDRRVPTVVASIAFVGLLIGIPIVGRLSLVADEYERGVQAANAGDFPTATALFRQAAIGDPDLPIHHLADGLMQARGGDLEAAQASLEAATADGYPVAWVNLAAVQAQLGDPTGAQASLDQASRLGVEHPHLALAMAAIRLQLGERSEAVEALADAFVASPSLVRDPFWSGDAPLAALFTDARARALELAPDSLGLAVEAGDDERARQLAEAFMGPEREAWQLYVDAMAGSVPAADQLWAYADAHPAFHAAVSLAALAAKHLGDAPRAEVWRALASTYTQFGAQYGRLPVVRLQPAPRELFMNETTTFYGPFTYGRQVPQDDLVPWLPHLVWE